MSRYLEWRDRIPNSSWQWIYGMLATVGLRPHEAFNCTFLDALTLQVHQQTKTGSRITRAIQPEWVELWNLTQIDRPEITKVS
ncbi:hypothetical protein [Myxacorys almedinensis]|uniref:Uncharacterized protein n=1 Tax=Myxacorys almedinensis A TaxID=2690445 RepID=A0A8J7Z893_9CYAN|nr:hypothetical protein [Myxacorys almedinensis]NDJ19951.1 hypothetical protein [Myxacorys almedinensis A]